MATVSPPSDQRAGVRPISFILDDVGNISAPVTLRIRPEDLTRSESSRASVHQTLGRDVAGWVDNFGPGLPTVAISGSTGWRRGTFSGMDGAEAFEQLNRMVMRDYHDAKQSAIDAGIDPAAVKLLFVDSLDNFAYPVVPTQFVLRRSKSRPLLFQYSITLQALSDTVDRPIIIDLPFGGSPSNGLIALDRTIRVLEGYAPRIDAIVAGALPGLGAALGAVASSVASFVDASNKVFAYVNDVLKGTMTESRTVTNQIIAIAQDLATVGVNTFRTVNNISVASSDLKAQLTAISAAYNELICLFKNSLKPKKVYEQYTGLYGASNCSSTTGGNPISRYEGQNVMELMQPARSPVTISSDALASIKLVQNTDFVLNPMSATELGRSAATIASGVKL